MIVGRLALKDHPTDPELQVGTIDGHSVVVGRHYDDGVLGFFIPDGAIIPDKLAKEMWVKGRLAGKKKNRVKAREMGGVKSDGLFYASRFAHEGDIVHSASWDEKWKEGDDVTVAVGIRE